MSSQSFGRRRFLAGMGGLAASPLVAAGGVRKRAADQAEPTALSKHETEILIAVLSRLIPSDVESGGAVEANAHVYIDRSLSGVYSKHLPLYREGLRVIDALARTEEAATRELQPERLDSILERLEAGKISELAKGGSAFFALILRHAIEGMFGDPIHGGNHAYIGWKLVGYPGIRLFSSQAEQALDAPLPEGHRSAADFGRRER
jgi:gluconate 2-dehydrogenase gamma chain